MSAPLSRVTHGPPHPRPHPHPFVFVTCRDCTFFLPYSRPNSGTCTIQLPPYVPTMRAVYEVHLDEGCNLGQRKDTDQ